MLLQSETGLPAKAPALSTFVAGQVPGNFHIALEVLTLEQRHLAAAEEAAAIFMQVPAFIFAAAMGARR